MYVCAYKCCYLIYGGHNSKQSIYYTFICLIFKLNQNANIVLTKCQHIHTNNTESNTVSFISPQTQTRLHTHTCMCKQSMRIQKTAALCRYKTQMPGENKAEEKWVLSGVTHDKPYLYTIEELSISYEDSSHNLPTLPYTSTQWT